jgi:hypothetical protein
MSLKVLLEKMIKNRKEPRNISRKRQSASAKAMELIRSHPVSSGFDNSTFNSLNTFRFINSKGAVVPVR